MIEFNRNASQLNIRVINTLHLQIYIRQTKERKSKAKETATNWLITDKEKTSVTTKALPCGSTLTHPKTPKNLGKRRLVAHFPYTYTPEKEKHPNRKKTNGKEPCGHLPPLTHLEKKTLRD